jgi:hypothetical protein
MTAAKLSPAGCGLLRLSTHIWSRLQGLPTHIWSRLCAYLVAPLVKSLYPPLAKEPVAGAAPSGDNPGGLPAIRLAPTRNSPLKKDGKP